MRPVVCVPLVSLALCAAVGCEPLGGDTKDSGGALLAGDDLESGCVPVDDTPRSWTETLSFASPEDAEQRSAFTSDMARGHGILRAEVSWSAYHGGPQVGFTNAQEEWVSAHVYPEDTPSLVAETTVGAGGRVELLATQFGTGLDEEYPITLDVAYQWTPVDDCWEDNSTVATLVDLPRDTPVEAMLVGSYASPDDAGFTHLSQDDHYRVRVPEGATTLEVDVSFPVQDGSLAISAFRVGEDSYHRRGETYAGGSYAATTTLSIDAEPGDWIVFVQQWEGPTFLAWATRTDDGPVRPDLWDQPYTLTVTTR